MRETQRQQMTQSDRRTARRSKAVEQRRRYPRFFLDADWFVEAAGCSTFGRGLEISVRSALLPVTAKSVIAEDVTLYVSLAERPRMFKAQGRALMRPGVGWVLNFHDVAPEDLQLLGNALISRYGLLALPNLERKYERFLDLPARHLSEGSL